MADAAHAENHDAEDAPRPQDRDVGQRAGAAMRRRRLYLRQGNLARCLAPCSLKGTRTHDPILPEQGGDGLQGRLSRSPARDRARVRCLATHRPALVPIGRRVRELFALD